MPELPEMPAARLVVTHEPAQLWISPDLRTPGRVLPAGSLARVVSHHPQRPRWVLVATEDDDQGWLHATSLARAVPSPTRPEVLVAGGPYVDERDDQPAGPGVASGRHKTVEASAAGEVGSAGGSGGRRVAWAIGGLLLAVGLLFFGVTGGAAVFWRPLAAPSAARPADSAATPGAGAEGHAGGAGSEVGGEVAVGAGSEVGQAAGDTGCRPGERPAFGGGFADLHARLGARMGEPLSCERYGPNGDALQQTTTGLARYSKAANVATFTRGAEHWALTERGVVHWTGRALDPPAEAAAEEGAPTVADSPGQAPTPPAGPDAQQETAPPRRAPQPTPAASALADGSWLAPALQLIHEYDRLHGTILSQALRQVRVVVVRIPGAWAAFVPSARTITLDPVLEQEAPEAVATVLAHEANHAVDWVLNGAIRSEVACYNYEISSFRLQAAVWQGLYGPDGKPDPQTELESELNEVLRLARTDAGRLISGIQSRYQDQCA